jgi:lysozyme
VSSSFIDLLVADLRRDEGVRLTAYVDSVGKITIGVGRNLTDVGISAAECEMLLAADIDRVMSDLDARLPWWRTLDEDRQGVLANMCFNLGINGLLQFKTTLGAIQAHNWLAAAEGMMRSKWAQQVGPRAQRLADRMAGSTGPAGPGV